MSDNPYEILGLSSDATPDEINDAYRKLARKAHPDAGGSTEEFTRVKNASMVLLDPKMREQLHRTGKIGDIGPDNTQAKVMEMIANFFITSIDNTDGQFGPTLATVDLVAVAKQHFKNQEMAAGEHIKGLKKKASKYKRALKRLKSKRDNDIVRQMIEHHMRIVENLVTVTLQEKEMIKMALAILDDYSFEPEDPMLTSSRQQGMAGFFR